MALKAVIKNLDDAPEALREYYAESNGQYVLGVSGMVPKDKVDEFRNNNIDLKKQMDELQKTVSSIDLDKYNEILKQQQDDQAASLIKDGKIDELIELKTRAQTDHFNAELQKITGERDTLTKQLEQVTIDNAVRNVAMQNGVAATAIDDVLMRAKSTFKLQDGKAIPFDGKNPIYQAGTTDPLSVEGWVKGLSESAPHLFANSSGGGARHNSGAPTGKTVSRSNFNEMNPVQQKSFVKDGGKVVD